MVLEQIVTTLASVADTAEEKFISHYDRFMPCLKYIVQNAVQQELRLLRGKTIECISLIGLAVGKEKVSYFYFRVQRKFVIFPDLQTFMHCQLFDR